MQGAIKILKRDGAVVFPTETLYALGAIATHKKAVKKVYSIKRRPPEKLLPVIVGSMEQAEQYFIFSRNALALAQKFWPGPLSIVLTAKSPEMIAALGSRSVAVRYPANAIACALALSVGAPITSTSANISGEPGCSTIAAAKKQFAKSSHTTQPDIFIDGGRLKKSLPSTIVQIKAGRLVFIREGKISQAKVLRFWEGLLKIDVKKMERH